LPHHQVSSFSRKKLLKKAFEGLKVAVRTMIGKLIVASELYNGNSGSRSGRMAKI
jgi:hypothetical protein